VGYISNISALQQNLPEDGKSNA